jgi:methylmalonyl-CoA mutase C-terminal domain/subunit
VAAQEDVDAIGLSILSGSHTELVQDTIRCLRELDAADKPVFVGGTIPIEDQRMLKDAGVREVFTADMRVEDVLAVIDRAFSS